MWPSWKYPNLLETISCIPYGEWNNGSNVAKHISLIYLLQGHLCWGQKVKMVAVSLKMKEPPLFFNQPFFKLVSSKCATLEILCSFMQRGAMRDPRHEHPIPQGAGPIPPAMPIGTNHGEKRRTHKTMPLVQKDPMVDGLESCQEI